MTKKHILSALNVERKTVYIDEVPNGKKCGCICTECGERLIAKNNGTVNIHHFAHESGNDNIKCSLTALHQLGEKIIIEDKTIPVFNNGTIQFDKVDFVEQEKNLGDIKPDLYAIYKGKPIALEIRVSHAVDEVKFFKIQNHKLTTFEIDLSNIVYETKEDVRKAIYDLKNIRPIYDETFTVQALTNKKDFIDKNGIQKKIVNGIVYQCSMNPILKSGQAQIGDIKSFVCEKCPFGYKVDNENYVHCIGHLMIGFSSDLFIARSRRRNINIPIPYDWQINVTKQKIVSLSELAEYFSLLTNQKFIVLKQRKKSVK